MLSTDMGVAERARSSIVPPRWRTIEVGDCGLLVSFADEIGDEAEAAVRRADRVLCEQPVRGVVEAVPSYTTLLVEFDPYVTSAAAVREALESRLAASTSQLRADPVVHWRLPVAYGGEHGPDLEEVARRHGLSPEQLIALHSGARYTVAMLGFLPGFAYLSGLPPGLATPRRSTPRPSMPPGIVAIGGAQTAIGSVAGPSGWNVIGRTPVATFAAHRRTPSLLSVGDRVALMAVSAAEFEHLRREAERGALVAERCEVAA